MRKLSALNLPVTVTAYDGRRGGKALQIKEHRPQIDFTDIRMAGMDGLTLCAKISKEYPGVKTVVISGYSEFEYAQKAIKCKVAGYLLKPLNTDEKAVPVGRVLVRRTAPRRAKRSSAGCSRGSFPARRRRMSCRSTRPDLWALPSCIGNLLEHATGGIDLSCGALWRHAGWRASLTRFCLPGRSGAWWRRKTRMNRCW